MSRRRVSRRLSIAEHQRLRVLFSPIPSQITNESSLESNDPAPSRTYFNITREPAVPIARSLLSGPFPCANLRLGDILVVVTVVLVQEARA